MFETLRPQSSEDKGKGRFILSKALGSRTKKKGVFLRKFPHKFHTQKNKIN
jgi:hypothetical protein